MMKKLWWIAIGVCVLGAVAPAQERFKLLATSRTGTMEKELNAVPPEFEFVAMTLFESTFGGKEAAVILQAEIGQR